MKVLVLILTILFAAMVPACKPLSASAGGAVHVERGPKANSPREQAGVDFSRNVQRWGWMLSGLLILSGLAVVIVSFTPLGSTFDLTMGEGLRLLAASAAIPLIQYALQAWGVLAMDVIVLASLAASLATAAVFGFRWYRRWRAA